MNRPYGNFAGPRSAPSVLARQQQPRTAPLDSPEEETLTQTLASRRFWREVAIEGIKAAGVAAIVYITMRYVEKR
jgi:hypothetical protein